MLYQFIHSGTAQNYCKEYGENFNFPMHLHQAYEFITVLDGEMSVFVNEKKYEIKSGEGMFIFPNQLHSLESKNSRHMLTIFPAELVKAYAVKVAGKIPKNNKFSLEDSLISAIDNLPDDASLFQKKGILYLLCASFDEVAEYEDKQDIDSGILDKIFEFVEKNFMKECTLGELCDSTGYSYSYLSRFFKKTTGVSINEYINQYRISQSCYLLSDTNITVLECAYECGYDTLRSFNRNFKEYMGKTPTEYRKINKKTE